MVFFVILLLFEIKFLKCLIYLISAVKTVEINSASAVSKFEILKLI